MLQLNDASAFSALIAPVIDRTAISVHNAVEKEKVSALRGEHRFAPGALSLFAGMLLGGPISQHEFNELMRYQHFGSSDAFLAGLAERGAITMGADGSISPTAAGAEVARRLVLIQADTIAAVWAPKQPSLQELSHVIMKARAAAVADPLSTLSKLTGRAWLSPDASDASLIWDAAVVLRMHRSDAHALAWAERGHTAQAMKQMQASDERSVIEDRTNELAATPWVPLEPHERLQLLAGLGALPGLGSPI